MRYFRLTFLMGFPLWWVLSQDLYACTHYLVSRHMVEWKKLTPREMKEEYDETGTTDVLLKEQEQQDLAKIVCECNYVGSGCVDDFTNYRNTIVPLSHLPQKDNLCVPVCDRQF